MEAEVDVVVAQLRDGLATVGDAARRAASSSSAAEATARGLAG